jgi:hypothetical protein
LVLLCRIAKCPLSQKEYQTKNKAKLYSRGLQDSPEFWTVDRVTVATDEPIVYVNTVPNKPRQTFKTPRAIRWRESGQYRMAILQPTIKKRCFHTRLLVVLEIVVPRGTIQTEAIADAEWAFLSAGQPTLACDAAGQHVLETIVQSAAGCIFRRRQIAEMPGAEPPLSPPYTP